MSDDLFDQLKTQWRAWNRETYGTPIGRLWGRMKSYGAQAGWSDPVPVPEDFDALGQPQRTDLCEFRVVLGREELASGVLGTRDSLQVISACLIEAGRKMKAQDYWIEVEGLGPDFAPDPDADPEVTRRTLRERRRAALARQRAGEA
ncbi:hypothetical protein [Deinococcus ficus]|uniref:Uncharacterized protein n=1 Tax=Deinococcus ficus TaxID=317577 RepID=A0A221T0R9_9DEIO|nr:hypothetical protein [Deinococcus ficus]ASN82466.1 hypothetical protein DFI_14885 [Deinococcus ficus]